MSESLEGFAVIQRRAACLFANRARIEAARPYSGLDARQAGLIAARQLAAFATRIEEDELDGLLIELTDRIHGATLQAVSRTTRSVVAALLDATGHTADVDLEHAGAEHWWLELFGTRWFILVFAPCYSQASPRSTFGSSSTYLLLQPVTAFDRHAVPRGGFIPDEVRRRIRCDYAQSGRPYDGALAQQHIEALKFVWPDPDPGIPVRWWLPAAVSEGDS